MKRVYSSLPPIPYVENGMKVQLKYPPSPKYVGFSECVKGASRASRSSKHAGFSKCVKVASWVFPIHLNVQHFGNV